jgi:hypothetical protein
LNDSIRDLRPGFTLKVLGGNFEEYVLEDYTYKESLELLQQQVTKIIKNKTIEREYLPSYLFSEKNLIIVIGQDGLVANTAKYSSGQPIVAVNPDKKRYDGILLPFDNATVLKGVEAVLHGRARTRTLRFAEAKLNDGQRLLGFNDLFIGPSSHVSARYKIAYGEMEEDHSSSGIIVSTQAGSTGWLSSIFNMAYGVTSLFDKNLKPKQPKLREDELLFTVREPFKSVRTQIGITTGLIKGERKLVVESYMPTNGIIFSDGIEQDFLQFNSGAIATVGLAREKTQLVMPSGAN